MSSADPGAITPDVELTEADDVEEEVAEEVVEVEEVEEEDVIEEVDTDDAGDGALGSKKAL